MKNKDFSVIQNDIETKYSLYELILKISKDFKFAESLKDSTIIDNVNGTLYDTIDNLLSEYKDRCSTVIELVGLGETTRKISLSKTLSSSVKEVMKNIYERKTKENTITSFEFLSYMILKHGVFENFYKQSKIQYQKFSIMNKADEVDKPEGLSWSDFGKFSRLQTMCYSDNAIRHMNGKPFSLKLLTSRLDFNGTRAKYLLEDFLNRLIAHNMVAYTRTKDNLYIIVNPIYSSHNVPISHMLYSAFPTEVNKLLIDAKAFDMAKYYEICSRESDENSIICSISDFTKANSMTVRTEKLRRKPKPKK